jgi:hypothetical protein
MSVIVKSVGKGGANVLPDVILVRTLLNKFIESSTRMTGLSRLPVSDPIKDSPSDVTIVAITRFQREFVEPYLPGFKVDGRLDPWGETIAILSKGPKITPPKPPTGPKSAKEKALALVGEFRARGKTGDPMGLGTLWPHISRYDLATGLEDRINNPFLIHQGASGLCGPASLLFVLARDKPEAYAKGAIELFEKGLTYIVNLRIEPDSDLRLYRLMPKAGIHVADWILMASIRDNENFYFDYQAENDNAEGMTPPFDMVNLFKRAGYTVTAEECNLVFTKDEACARRANAAFNRGEKVSLFIHSQMLSTEKEKRAERSPWPDHWVALASPISFTPSDDTQLVSCSVFTWGHCRAVPYNDALSLEDFCKNFYGYISCRAW